MGFLRAVFLVLHDLHLQLFGWSLGVLVMYWAAVCVSLPDILVVVNVDLVELLRHQIFIYRGHVSNHLQNQKPWQDGHDQTLLEHKRALRHELDIFFM